MQRHFPIILFAVPILHLSNLLNRTKPNLLNSRQNARFSFRPKKTIGFSQALVRTENNKTHRTNKKLSICVHIYIHIHYNVLIVW